MFVYIIIIFPQIGYLSSCIFDNHLNHIIYKINDAFYDVFYFK